ncbi:WXG100 family type VII secretion target [Nocardia sp. NPDC052566]|uniref:WXG100 family type VII secretion target n=1 Tax=Nocardia sp. NPDC052566 TaxID=3364330 RepID=UPI0037C8410E
MTAGSAAPLAMVPENVSNAGQFVSETAQALADGIRSADAEVAQLMSSWRGTAASAYWQGWSETRQGALQVFDALREMAELLGVTVTTTIDTDTRTADGVRASSLKM